MILSFLILGILYIHGVSGGIDANFTLQNIWGRLPQPGLRSIIQCASGDGSSNGIKFFRKVDTGQGKKLPKSSRLFWQGHPVLAQVLLMPKTDGINRFGAFGCRLKNSDGTNTEIVTLKLPLEDIAELDAVLPYIVVNRGDDVDLEVIKQKELNHTLKWKHNGGDDIDEWDGETNVHIKNAQVSDEGVYECYYEGRRKESVHAIFRLIVRACPAESFGDNCESICPSCYNGGICHDKEGICVCPAGFTGEYCQTPCGGNHFGADCSKVCSPPQAKSSTDDGCAYHLFCKPDPYGCSCAPGFKGPKCATHCKPGWYGADCKQRCHCASGSKACNRITGNCDGGCAGGWRGTSCEIEDPNATLHPSQETTTMAQCPLGHFGSSCEKKCHCAGNEPCDVISGQCPYGCEEGWAEASCSACMSGRFGDNCESTCHCEGGDHNCDEEGYCLAGCKSGWAGFTCQQECTAGRFGSNCASTCHCKDGASACDKFTGVCIGDCLPGYMGRDCQTMCPQNTYGVNCAHTCTCSNGGQCSRINGTCSCEGRWRGTICNESEPQIIAAKDDEVNLGQLIYISCTADAIPAPVLNIESDKFPDLNQIFRKLEQDQYQARVKVQPQEPGDFDFACTARNSHGFDMKIVTLSVISPPRLVDEPELLSSSNISLEVKWEEWSSEKDDGGRNEDKIEYKVVYRTASSTQWKSDSWTIDLKAMIRNLEPDTEYQIAVVCRRPGKGGEGEPSPYMNVKTDCGDPLTDSIPRDFLPEVLTSTSVKLAWTPPAESLLKCTLLGYKLVYSLKSNPTEQQVLGMTDEKNEAELKNLQPHSTYVLHLHPVTFMGDSKYFAELIIHTTETTPDPVRDLQCIPDSKNPDELLVRWKEPVTTSGLKGYLVTHKLINRGQCGERDQANSSAKKSTLLTNTELVLTGLHAYSTYSVSVQAKATTSESVATTTSAITAASSPNVEPPNVQLVSKTSTSLEFKWDPIPCELANGEILHHEYTLVTSEFNELSSHIAKKKRSIPDLDGLPVKVNGLGVVIGDLKPKTEYGFAVRGTTVAGNGPFSDFLYEKTAGAEPQPPGSFRALSSTNSSLTLTWSTPDKTDEEITEYRIEYHIVKEPGTEKHVTFNRTILKVTSDGKATWKILGLTPDTEYILKIQAASSSGWGKWSNQLSARTSEGVPQPPNSFALLSSTSSSLTLIWSAPEKAGDGITEYRIKYHVENEPVTEKRTTFNVTVLKVTTDGSFTGEIQGLSAYTEYILKIQAGSNEGWGKWSNLLSARTAEGVPSAPLNLTKGSKTKTSLEISWVKPLDPNGVITGYKITYSPTRSLDPYYNVTDVETVELTSAAQSNRIVLNNLHSSTEYEVEVKANTSAGYGPPSVIGCWTEILDDHLVPGLETVADEVTNETIPILITTTGRSVVSKYQVIVEDSRNKHEIDVNLLSGYEEAVVKEGLPYYIAAEIDPNDVSDSGQHKFVVGDNKTWGGYSNVHLNPGHRYRIRIRTLIQKDQGSKSLWSGAKEYDSKTPRHTYKSKPTIEIVGLSLIEFILAVACILVVIIATVFLTTLFICRKKERQKASKGNRDSGLSESMTWSVMYKVSENEAVDGPLVSEGYKVMHGNDNAGMSLKKVKKDSKTSIGIKVENLQEYVPNAVAGNRLAEEFKKLAAGQTTSWTVARKSENLKKNRYGNILPYDRQRVVLHFDHSGSGSDYINASYIDGYRRPKEYIVTQGPLEDTVVDFWRMVWQESVPVIIMITELVENGKQKCVKYWPDDSMVCGKLQILLIHSEQNTNFVIRTILIRSVEEGKTHRVHHYQFTDWPDRTIPLSPCFLIKMMKRSRNDHPVMGGPMIVHCSSGAGRSGTYVALDTLTQQAEDEKRVDIFRFINCARLQRINFVETLEQYVFIHEALLEAIQYENTSVPLNQIAVYLKELENSQTLENSSPIQKQYNMLGKSPKSVNINHCSDALTECNIFKNRDPMTLPADTTRIRLNSDCDEDYINAVTVNSYRKKDAYIVTQMPLEHTVEDFWQMVYQCKSSLLLMLNGCDTEDGLDIGQYWPNKGQALYGKFEVQVVTFEDQGDVIIRIMRLVNSCKPHEEPFKVIQLQYKAWNGDLPPQPQSMMNLVSLVEMWYSRSSGGPITVHCLNGATQSGLFCAVSYICAQVKSEEHLDAFQAVKDIRINRPEFIPTLGQYKYCFEVAEELSKSIAEKNSVNTLTRKKLSCYG